MYYNKDNVIYYIINKSNAYVILFLYTLRCIQYLDSYQMPHSSAFPLSDTGVTFAYFFSLFVMVILNTCLFKFAHQAANVVKSYFLLLYIQMPPSHFSWWKFYIVLEGCVMLMKDSNMTLTHILRYGFAWVKYVWCIFASAFI